MFLELFPLLFPTQYRFAHQAKLYAAIATPHPSLLSALLSSSAIYLLYTCKPRATAACCKLPRSLLWRVPLPAPSPGTPLHLTVPHNRHLKRSLQLSHAAYEQHCVSGESCLLLLRLFFSFAFLWPNESDHGCRRANPRYMKTNEFYVPQGRGRVQSAVCGRHKQSLFRLLRYRLSKATTCEAN